MQTSTQRGSGALVMVMMILLMGTLMLNATRRQLDDSMSLVGDERHYLQQFTGAMSALAWGERLHWVAAEEWHCQQQVEHHWRACFQPVDQLLRGDSGPDTLALYRWVGQQANGTLQAQPHGWLDYCPLTGEGACDVN